jgi:hypothetical protein
MPWLHHAWTHDLQQPRPRFAQDSTNQCFPTRHRPHSVASCGIPAPPRARWEGLSLGRIEDRQRPGMPDKGHRQWEEAQLVVAAGDTPSFVKILRFVDRPATGIATRSSGN